jgi:hypothetical protein
MGKSPVLLNPAVHRSVAPAVDLNRDRENGDEGEEFEVVGDAGVGSFFEWNVVA